jgi:adenylosuccinate lyase
MNQILKKLSVNTQNILEKNTLYEAKSSSHKQMLALQEQGKSRFEAYECSSKQVNIQEKD